MRWIASRTDPCDRGEAGTPAFPYKLYRPVSKLSDVLEVFGSDSEGFRRDLGDSGFQALVRTIAEINAFPRLFTSHTVVTVDQRKPFPDVFDWATYRASCAICILPSDQAVPDLGTVRRIVNELHRVLLEQLQNQRLSPPKGSWTLIEPIVMKFGRKSQGVPTMGFAVHMLVEGYAGKASQASVRCGCALALMGELLAQARL